MKDNKPKVPKKNSHGQKVSKEIASEELQKLLEEMNKIKSGLCDLSKKNQDSWGRLQRVTGEWDIEEHTPQGQSSEPSRKISESLQAIPADDHTLYSDSDSFEAEPDFDLDLEAIPAYEANEPLTADAQPEEQLEAVPVDDSRSLTAYGRQLQFADDDEDYQQAEEQLEAVPVDDSRSLTAYGRQLQFADDDEASPIIDYSSPPEALEAMPVEYNNDSSSFVSASPPSQFDYHDNSSPPDQRLLAAFDDSDELEAVPQGDGRSLTPYSRGFDGPDRPFGIQAIPAEGEDEDEKDKFEKTQDMVHEETDGMEAVPVDHSRTFSADSTTFDGVDDLPSKLQAVPVMDEEAYPSEFFDRCEELEAVPADESRTFVADSNSFDSVEQPSQLQALPIDDYHEESAMPYDRSYGQERTSASGGEDRQEMFSCRSSQPELADVAAAAGTADGIPGTDAASHDKLSGQSSRLKKRLPPQRKITAKNLDKQPPQEFSSLSKNIAAAEERLFLEEDSAFLSNVDIENILEEEDDVPPSEDPMLTAIDPRVQHLSYPAEPAADTSDPMMTAVDMQILPQQPSATRVDYERDTLEDSAAITIADQNVDASKLWSAQKPAGPVPDKAPEPVQFQECDNQQPESYPAAQFTSHSDMTVDDPQTESRDIDTIFSQDKARDTWVRSEAVQARSASPPQKVTPQDDPKASINERPTDPQAPTPMFRRAGASEYGKDEIIDNRYRVIEKLGRGGMGIVYKVEHARLKSKKKYLALKVLHAHVAQNPRVLKRFQREIEVMMDFDHENIVTIRDFGQDRNGNPYFTMDLCTGVALDKIIEQQPLSINDALNVTNQILNALASAHAKKIIHRDLKPENIIVENLNGRLRVRILDFGIAKNLSNEITEKITVGIVGTILYMSPEQAQGAEVGITSDIYSLGVTLYQMITGKVPFDGTTQEVLYKQIHVDPIAPRYLRRNIPPAVEQLILKAMAKEPGQRYQNAQEFAQAVAEVAATLQKPKARKTTQHLPASDQMCVGDIINGKYKIVDLLGEGGMGVVYKVEHLELSDNTKKYFALKLLHPHCSQEADFRERFVREVKLAMEFSHENVVQIREFGVSENNQHFFTMDFSPGVPLSAILAKNKKLAPERALSIVRQVLCALKTPHSKKIAHRDLKPDNILIETRDDKDHVLVLDFGIAKILESSSERLTGEAIIGTPTYMSPEQAGGDPLDVRTDYYSLGVILYETLTGVVPFQGKAQEVIFAHMVKEPAKPQSIVAEVPLAVEQLVLKAMSKERQQRFRSAEEFIEAIDQIEHAQKRLQRRRKLRQVLRVVLATMLLALIVGAAGGYYWLREQNRKLGEKFDLAIAERNVKQGNDSLQQMQGLWYGANFWIFPEQLQQYALRLRIEQLLQKDELANVEGLLKQMRGANIEARIVADVEKRWQDARRRRSLIEQAVAAVNEQKLDQAIQYVDQAQKIADDPVLQQLGLLLSLHRQASQALAQKKWGKALSLLDGDCQTIRQRLRARFSLAALIEEQKELAAKAKKEQSLENLRPVAQAKLEDLAREIQQKQLLPAEKLLDQLHNLPKVVVDQKRLNELQKLYQMEKDFALIQALPYEKQRQAFKEFIGKYPDSPYRQEITTKMADYQRQDLQDELNYALQTFKQGDFTLARKQFEVVFARSSYKLLPKNLLKQGALCLGKIYYTQKDWRQAGRWLSRAYPHPEALAYIGLVYYRLQRDSRALSLIGRALQSGKISEELKKELRQAQITAYSRHYPQRRSALFDLLRQAVAEFPETTPYYKKLALLAIDSGKKSEAITYFNQYLQRIKQPEQQDPASVNRLLELQDFYPLEKGYFWKYEVSKPTEGRIFNILLQIISQSGNEFIRRDNNNYQEELAIKNGFVVRGQKNKILPRRVNLDSQWERPGFKVKVTSYRQPIKVEIKGHMREFDCLVLTATSWRHAALVIKEYYAPGVGEVKAETYLNGNKIYQRVLKDYQTR